MHRIGEVPWGGLHAFAFAALAMACGSDDGSAESGAASSATSGMTAGEDGTGTGDEAGADPAGCAESRREIAADAINPIGAPWNDQFAMFVAEDPTPISWEWSLEQQYRFGGNVGMVVSGDAQLAPLESGGKVWLVESTPGAECTGDCADACVDHLEGLVHLRIETHNGSFTYSGPTTIRIDGSVASWTVDMLELTAGISNMSAEGFSVPPDEAIHRLMMFGEHSTLGNMGRIEVAAGPERGWYEFVVGQWR